MRPMRHLADLLAAVPLPALPRPAGPATPSGPSGAPGAPRPPGRDGVGDGGLVHDLAADLPAGHLHVWGGPPGAGKTAFLLSLLHAAAGRGRGVVYATYDLHPASLALRLLAMTAGIDRALLPDSGAVEGAGTPARPLPADALARAHAARADLARLPFDFLAARGFGVRSIRDRLVRLPFRAGVLAVDYLQGVVRTPGTEAGRVLQDLADLASQLHLAVVCAVRAGEVAGDPPEELGLARPPAHAGRGLLGDAIAAPPIVADRVGWIARAAQGTSCRAEVLRSRYGDRPTVPLRFDEATGGVARAEDAAADDPDGGALRGA
jgi:hypothetical protein